MRDKEYDIVLTILNSICYRRFYLLLRARMYVELKRYEDARNELMRFTIKGSKNNNESNEVKELMERIERETNISLSLSFSYSDQDSKTK